MLEGQELVGYLASALVVASLAMTSVVRLRLLSFAGSIAFVAYGVLIGPIPIIVTNTAIAGLNVWFLRHELGGRRDLGAVVVARDSPFLVDFLHHHIQDIKRFQPEFDEAAADESLALVLTREGLPAGVLLGSRRGGLLDLTLDYVLKPYRDSRLGDWVYGRGSHVLRSLDVSAVTSPPGNDTHRAYLQRIGFRADPGSTRLTRDL